MNILDIAIAKKLAGGGGGSGTDNYNDLSNLPKINDTTLSGNKSSSALGLQSEINSDSKLASDLVDDTNQDNKFVTSTEKNTWNAKQNAIDSDHKLSSDLVDDANHTNKFVTSTEKNTWNAKQNAIDSDHKLSSDLVDDANKTNKFVTSTEKNTWNAKQNAIDADHKLSSSLVSFSTAEAAALASGIDSSKVGQISTNQTNILYGLNRNAKNLIDFKFNDTPTTGTGYYWDTACDLPAGTYSISFLLTSTAQVGLYVTVDGSDISKFLQTGTKVSHEYTFTANSAITRVRFWINGGENIIYDFMISLKDVYDADHTYESYGAPNSDLTYLEAEDRAALAEVVDSGAKNLYNPSTISGVPTGLTVTRESDGTTLKINGTYTGSNPAYITVGVFNTSKTGIYYLATTCTKATNPTTYYIYTSDDHLVNSLDSVASYNYTSAPNTNVTIRVSPNASFNSDTVKILISTKAAFGVSSKFVPYRPNYDLVVSDLNTICFKRLPMNSSYNYRGIIVKTNRAVVQLAIMSNNYVFGGVITLAYNSHNSMTANVSANFKDMSQYVKFYKLPNENVAIIAYTETKWDSISYIGGTETSTAIEIYQSNTAYPTGASEFTPTAFPT